MIHSPAQILAQHLIDQGIGTTHTTTSDWSVFVDHAPTPDDLVPKKIISVINQTAIIQGRYHSNRSGQQGKTVKQEGIQCVIRSDDPNDAWTKANDIANRFDAILRTNVTVEKRDYLVQSVTLVTSIVSLGEDPELRLRNFSLNATASIRQKPI